VVRRRCDSLKIVIDRVGRVGAPSSPSLTAVSLRLVSLSLILLSFVACRRPTASLRAERIPKGTGWHCWTGRCDRVCRGLPGPPDGTGFAPKPVCADPKTAFCITYDMGTKYQLELEPHWECFDTRVSCEANQRHYVADAKQGRDYWAVSPCTELP
jgi:hypothetical protein